MFEIINKNSFFIIEKYIKKLKKIFIINESNIYKIRYQ